MTDYKMDAQLLAEQMAESHYGLPFHMLPEITRERLYDSSLQDLAEQRPGTGDRDPRGESR